MSRLSSMCTEDVVFLSDISYHMGWGYSQNEEESISFVILETASG